MKDPVHISEPLADVLEHLLAMHEDQALAAARADLARAKTTHDGSETP